MEHQKKASFLHQKVQQSLGVLDGAVRVEFAKRSKAASVMTTSESPESGVPACYPKTVASLGIQSVIACKFNVDITDVQVCYKKEGLLAVIKQMEQWSYLQSYASIQRFLG